MLACGQHILAIGYKNMANIITGPVRYQLWEAYINWMSKLVATGMPGHLSKVLCGSFIICGM